MSKGRDMPGVLMRARAGEAYPSGFPWKGLCWGEARGWFEVRGVVVCVRCLVPHFGCPRWSQPCTHLSTRAPPLPPHAGCHTGPHWVFFLNEMLSRCFNIRQEAFLQALAVPRSAEPVRGKNPLPDSAGDTGNLLLQNCCIFS